MTDYLYGLCSVCGKQLLDDDELHSDEDGEDCHADCCPVCKSGLRYKQLHPAPRRRRKTKESEEG